ncbi:hypothetical protein SASPL_111034 [Salvia splendens]|uniref:TF-B3 domain-containing protein n=1 Tax=Salvia splendens TaxID=180675 RepID=A0A8X8YB57_SALSN|nr:hypothetical protein SASPL_111034 [Salvia splendens]
MGDNGAMDYFRLSSFMKKFSEDHSLNELAIHGADLPFHCRLVMPRRRSWPIRLLKIASGCHFHAGWSNFRIINDIVHDDVLTFTMVDAGNADSDHSDTSDVDTSDDYEPSETEVDSSDDDDDDYAPDQGVVEDDGCPTFTVTLER